MTVPGWVRRRLKVGSVSVVGRNLYYYCCRNDRLLRELSVGLPGNEMLASAGLPGSFSLPLLFVLLLSFRPMKNLNMNYDRCIPYLLHQLVAAPGVGSVLHLA